MGAETLIEVAALGAAGLPARDVAGVPSDVQAELDKAGLVTRNQKAIVGSVQRAIDIVSTSFSSDVQRVYCAGYQTYNDAGAHWRERVLDAASHTLTSADGAHWRVCKGQKENVHMFGAVGDGTMASGAAAGTDDQPAIQRNIQWGIDLDTPFVVRLLDYTYKIGNEIDFSGCIRSFAIVGEGPYRSILAPTPFGTSKAVIALTCNTASFRVRRITLTDFMIGRNSTRAEDPMGIYAPYAQRLTIERIDLLSLGNTAIWTSSPFNCDWRDINADASGNQPLVKTVSSTARVSFTAGNPTVTANENIWSAGDVGKTFYMLLSGFPAGIHCSTIKTYVSPTEITLEHAPAKTAANVTCSFDAMRGSIANGSQTLQLNAPLAATDNGRFIYIAGGGYGNGGGGGNGFTASAHVARITGVSGDGLTITIDMPAVSEANDVRVWLSPTIYIGGSDVYNSALSAPANDIKIWNVKIEQFNGPAVMAHAGLFLFMNDLKCHGLSPSNNNNFAVSQNSFVASDMTLTQLKHLEWEFGCHGLDSGNLLMIGDSAVEIDSIGVSGAQRGGYLVDMRGPNATGFLQLGNVTYSQDVAEVFAHSDAAFAVGPVRCSSRELMRRVSLSGGVNGTSRQGDVKLLPGRGESTVIPDDSVYSIKLGSGHGRLDIWSKNPSVFGGFYINTTSVAAISTQGFTGAIVATGLGIPTGTTGTDGNVTMYASPGYIHYENRSGAPISLYWSIAFDQEGTLWTPSDLGADLLAFWDAENAGAFSLSGSAVASWTDSAHGYVLAQGTAGNRPQRNLTGINGRPCVTFDGVDDYLNMASTPLPIGPDPMEAWVLWGEDGGTGSSARFIWRSGGGDSTVSRSMGRNGASGTQRLAVVAGDSSVSASAVRDADITGVHVLRGVFAADRVRASVDGSNFTSASIALNTPTGLMRVGASTASTPANFAQGRMSALVFTRPLSVEKSARMLDFLSSRNGLLGDPAALTRARTGNINAGGLQVYADNAAAIAAGLAAGEFYRTAAGAVMVRY